MKQTVSAGEVETRLRELLHGVFYQHNELVIEQDGKPMAVVIPAYIPWVEEEGRYVLTFFPPVEIARTGSMQDDIRENTQRFAKSLEGLIRRHPEQWLWIHKRWKTRPPGEPGVY